MSPLRLPDFTHPVAGAARATPPFARFLIAFRMQRGVDWRFTNADAGSNSSDSIHILKWNRLLIPLIAGCLALNPPPPDPLQPIDAQVQLLFRYAKKQGDFRVVETTQQQFEDQAVLLAESA